MKAIDWLKANVPTRMVILWESTDEIYQMYLEDGGTEVQQVFQQKVCSLFRLTTGLMDFGTEIKKVYIEGDR